MDEQQKAEIGSRLRDLRDNSPETNRSIADYTDVSERTVAAWAGAEQGMTYDHAQKVAKLFGVDIDWLWRGREPGPAPDPFATESASGSDLARIEKKLDQVLENQGVLLAAVDRERGVPASSRSSGKAKRQAR